MSSPIARCSSGLLASVFLVAVVSGLIALLQPRVPALYLLVLYLLVIMPVAIVWGTGLAAVTAVLSVAVYAYEFLPPLHWLRVVDSQAIVGRLAGGGARRAARQHVGCLL